ncbi:hypothetical protein [Spiribacter roseus]|uniref:hypothetical protein n=1 Tax=Spiribacter roseus TaxID=1855875 RepID=UPI00133113F3|nr:hypothetical protein [Spiribacter roseus]KAF0284725.1 hypothetical protein BA898_06190 [Spiribacter roseus]
MTDQKHFTLETLEKAERRLARLMRLIELKAPQMVLEEEYRWFQIETDRADKRIHGLPAPYSEEQQAKLAWLEELEQNDEPNPPE